MMDNIPVHMRISGLQITNEDVDSRRSAAGALATSWGKSRNISDVLSKAAEIADALGGDGSPPDTLGAEVEAAVQKRASAFLSSERPLEVSVCAGMAVVSMMKPEPTSLDWTVPDLLATALWSALAFQPALQEEKREALRTEVLTAVRDRSVKAAEKARERVAVPDSAELTVTIDEAGKATTNLKKSMAGTIDTLRRNAALDREELDFLWWAQLGRSRLLGKSLATIAEPVRLVASGIEAAGHLRRLPCEVHRDLVLRTVDADPELDLVELMAAIGGYRATLGAPYQNGMVAAAPSVFPLLHAIATGAATGASATVKRKASNWGARALLEAGLAQITAKGPGSV